ncbi:hypothetical protein H2203_006433 [Taxawa tesnikishii (nom. ined.)]|nr:hypothetical protein H2203_006433 [Dothideales sp. JES 119]
MQCRSNTSWYEHPRIAWNTTLATTFRPADVVYSRQNWTIISHTFTTAVEEPITIKATELLNAYDSLFEGTSSTIKLLSPALESFIGNTSANSLLGSSASETAGASSDDMAAISGIIDSLMDSGDLETKRASTVPASGSQTDTSYLSFLLPMFNSLLPLINTSSNSDLSSSSLLESIFSGSGQMGSSPPTFPLVFYGTLHTAAALGENSVQAYGVDALQNLLAIPIFYCQKTMVARGALSGANLGLDIPTNSSGVGENGDIGSAAMREAMRLLGLDPASLQSVAAEEPDARVELGRLRYEVHVGRATLIAYIVLNCLVLLLCLVALAIASLDPRGSDETTPRYKRKLAGRIPDLFGYLPLDQWRFLIADNGRGSLFDMSEVLRGLGEPVLKAWVLELRIKVCNDADWDEHATREDVLANRPENVPLRMLPPP